MNPISSGASRTPRDIAFLVFHDFQIQDLTGPLAAFEVAGGLLGDDSYRYQVISLAGGPVRSSAGLEAVSYTHLDVYKRQARLSARPSRACARTMRATFSAWSLAAARDTRRSRLWA